MVLLSIKQYTDLINDIETKLDEADRVAESTDTRYMSEEVFSRVRKRIDE